MSKRPPRVRVYTTRSCSQCHRLKEFLRNQRVAFLEQDVQRNQRAFAEFQRLGGRSVPLLVIGDKPVRNLDQRKLRSTLARFGLTSS